MIDLKRIPALLLLVTFILTALLLTGGFAQEPSSRCGLVTLNDKPLTLAGAELKVGDKAPGFELLDVDSNTVSKETFKGKIMVISVMPSIDTPT